MKGHEVIAAGLVLALTAGIVAILGHVQHDGTTTNDPTNGSDRPAATASASEAQQQLDELTVVVRPHPAGDYRRAAFGSAWADVEGNGCNQRDDVLARDADKTQPLRVVRQHACDHDVIAGTWRDPYTGKTLIFDDLKQQRQAQAIPIDHRVALAVAWRYGARDWTDQQRLAYANDLANLVAVDGPTNSSKSDHDAATWRPRKAHQCSYATSYITTKHRWNLHTDTSERAALIDMLTTCTQKGR